MTTWVLVTDRTSARFFEKRGASLTLLERIEFPEGRVADQNIESGAPHRTFDRHAHGRQGDDRGDSPHERAAARFASRLALHLESSRERGAFDQLVLVAEPHFLGLLRSELSDPVRALVVASVQKDLHATPEEGVLQHLESVFPG